MSEDFDKSESPTGIDFHEAERLFILAFEANYPAFIEYFNKRIMQAGIDTSFWITWVDQSCPTIRDFPLSGGPQPTPIPDEVVTYAKKIGYDAYFNQRHSAAQIDWSRRDTGKWGS